MNAALGSCARGGTGLSAAMKTEFHCEPSIGSEIGERRVRDAGDRANPRDNSVKKVCRRASVHCSPASVKRRRQQMIGSEAGVDARQLLQRAHHQTRRRSSSTMASAVSTTISAAAQAMRARGNAGRPRCARAPAVRAIAGRLKRRKRRRRRRRRSRRRASANSSAAPSSCTSADPRRPLRRGRDQARGAARSRHSDAEHAAGRGDERALDEQLARQPQASAAERGADRELVLARRTARDQQVGDVDAGNQQQAADGAEQREQRQADVGDEPIGSRSVADADAGVGRGIFALERAAIVFNSRSRRLDGDAGLQPSDAR